MEQQNEALDNISRLENDDDVRLRDIFEILNPSNQSPDLNGTYNPVDIQPLSNITHVTNNIANNLPQSASLPLLGQGTTFQQLTSQQSPQQQQQQQQHQQQQQQQQPVQPSHARQHRSGQKPYINIVEQPAGKALRFRYECEGRSAGSIPGVNNTPENKTYPTIEIVGYKGEVVIVVSCVTKDQPYRPHPHKLVGKEGCKDGICSLKLKGDPMRAVFSNLGIQCVKRKEIRSALEMRERLAVDPFKTEFGHKDQPSSIDLNAVRLCFQAFITNATGTKSLKPVVSDPIYDKKAMSDLMICRLCSCSAKVAGGDEIILLCEKVAKDDIRVKFFEINNENNVIWEDFAEFKQTDIHKQTAIAFRTPRYHNTDIVDKAKVFLQLLRPSDGAVSEPLPFEYYPDPGTRTFNRIRRKLKRKEDLEIFQQILSLDSETTATKYSCPPTDVEIDNYDIETVSSDSSASKPHSTDTLNEYEEAVKRETSADTDGTSDHEREKIRELEIELEVPQINYPVADESTQTSTPMEEILKHQQLDEPRQLSMVDKITEWMRSSEMERTDSLTVENGDLTSLSPVTVYTNVSSISATNHTTISNITDEDKTFTDLMEQVAELDNMLAESQSRRGTLDNPILKELPMGGALAADVEGPDLGDVGEVGASASAQASVDIDETFDETATYTSLQIAFKNPIDIPQNDTNKESKQNKPNSLKTGMIVNEEDGLVVLTNPPAPKIRVNAAQTPPSPPTPPIPQIPPRTPSPVFDQCVPPLPPKRKTSQEFSSSDPTPSTSMEHSRNGSISSRPPSQIIIMRTPDQSPTKRQPTPTSSPKKKQSFFSRFFSRRKSSKNELNPNDETNSKSAVSKSSSPLGSRDPSVGHFSINDPNRSSIRSAKSAQSNSCGLSPQNSIKSGKNGKPVGRSVSSVSGKRPAHLNADVIHIPLKGDGTETYSSATAITFGRQFDRKTLSALHLADIPICDGNMELVAIADRQSIKNLCEGAYGVVLDADVDLSEAEHFALYTSIPPQAIVGVGGVSTGTGAEGEENSSSSEVAEAFLTPEEIARRLAEANGLQ